MTLIGRYFGLSDAPGGSVSCGTSGVFVGEVPLLQRSCSRNGFQQWEPRPVRDLNRDLSKRYGIPIDSDAKSGGLIAIARALNRGDLLHAQITTLHLQIPDPPPLTKSAQTNNGRRCCTGAATTDERTTQSGLGPSQTSVLASWYAEQHRRRIRAARRCRRRFRYRGAQCAPHTGTTYPPSSFRLGDSARSATPLAVRDRAGAVCAAGCKPHHHPSKSLSRSAEMREGVENSNARLFGVMGRRPVRTGLYSRNGHND
jgi:hypothetical protein